MPCKLNQCDNRFHLEGCQPFLSPCWSKANCVFGVTGVPLRIMQKDGAKHCVTEDNANTIRLTTFGSRALSPSLVPCRFPSVGIGETLRALACIRFYVSVRDCTCRMFWAVPTVDHYDLQERPLFVKRLNVGEVNDFSLQPMNLIKDGILFRFKPRAKRRWICLPPQTIK
jgi:hypothetical protein